MFDGLIQLIKELWAEYIQWWYYLPQYKGGVVLRNGVFHRDAKPGYKFKLPFFEELLDAFIVPTTNDLKQQSLVTTDGKQFTVRGMIKSEVSDVKKFLLEVYDQMDALSDTAMGIIAEIITTSSSDDLKNIEEINKKITIKVRAAAKTYGLQVIKVTLIDITPARSIRLFVDRGDDVANLI